MTKRLLTILLLLGYWEFVGWTWDGRAVASDEANPHIVKAHGPTTPDSIFPRADRLLLCLAQLRLNGIPWQTSLPGPWF